MLEPICLNYRHEILVKEYLDVVMESIKEITNEERKYKDFVEVAESIIAYHNKYKSDIYGNANYLDFVSIIPSHFAAMVNGYLTGLQEEGNRRDIMLYKKVLNDCAYGLLTKLEDNISLINE